MKTALFLFALSAVMSAGCAADKEKDIKIVAHRGYWNTGGAVRNSVAALRNAVTEGFFGSEFDVLVTADGVPVVHHDDRTSNGIRIENVTYAELMERASRLGNGERIPTLDEYILAWDHAKTKLILEIKSASTPEKESFFVQKVLETVRRHNLEQDEIEYIAFSWHVCRELKRLDSKATVSYLEGDKSPKEVMDAGLDGIDYNHKVFHRNPNWVKQAQDLGLIVNVWTVNSSASMRDMINLGVDYITTDNPLELREILGK